MQAYNDLIVTINLFPFPIFYFLLYKEVLPGTEDANFENTKFGATLRKSVVPWKGDDDKLKPCWLKPYEGKI